MVVVGKPTARPRKEQTYADINWLTGGAELVRCDGCAPHAQMTSRDGILPGADDRGSNCQRPSRLRTRKLHRATSVDGQRLTARVAVFEPDFSALLALDQTAARRPHSAARPAASRAVSQSDRQVEPSSITDCNKPHRSACSVIRLSYWLPSDARRRRASIGAVNLT